VSNLIFRALLSGLRWESLIRILGLHERVKGIGEGKVEGYRYTIVQRGDEILIILPDYAPREKCQEVAKKILLKLTPKSKIQVATMGYASSHCNFCLKSTNLKRCSISISVMDKIKWSLRKDLPEKHNCPGEEEKTEKIAERLKPKKQEKKKEIIVAEVPCG